MSSTFFGISNGLYFIAMVTYVSYVMFRKNGIAIAATGITALGFASQTAALIYRWIDSYAFWLSSVPSSDVIQALLRSAPLRNLYESLIFFVWALILFHLIIEYIYKNRTLGAFVLPVAALALAFITFTGMNQNIEPLVPALQSNWLLFHVFLSFIGYAAFGVAFGAGLMYLILTTEKKDATYFWAGIAVVFCANLISVLFLKNIISFMAVNAALFIAFSLVLNYKLLKTFIGEWKTGDSGTQIMNTIIIAVILILDIFFAFLLISSTASIVIPIILAGGSLYIKYLLLNKDIYLFWTTIIGIFLVVLIAMGVDFINLTTTQRGEFLQSYFLRASFKSASGLIMVLSWVISISFLYTLYRYGSTIKQVLLGLSLDHHMLDDITYKSIAVGFPLFTIGGVIMGAIWANSAWGTYWSWDPKETWSLITWFVYAIYLHARLVAGWRGDRAAVIAVVGFIAVIFTYLGVNLVLSGLHSYGGS